jgi:hypothetical protein
MWPGLTTVFKLEQPAPTISSTSAISYPVPSVATRQRKRGGCRTKSKPERGELERFWGPLIKGATQKARKAQPRVPSVPQSKPGKRSRPSSQEVRQLESWMQGDAAQQTQSSQRTRAHAEAPMGRSQGKTRLMSPSACVNFHPFTETLREWEEGVPVDCGEDWTLEQIEAAISQGPHQSALTPESLELIEEDVAYQVRAGYAEVVDWEWLKENPPAKLKISPLAVVPQANRRGRMILDLSFPVLRQDRKRGRKKQRGREPRDILKDSVNDTTVRLAPDVPVKELGNVLKRLLRFMQEVPAEEHIQLSKIDLADGYWRMIVEETSRWNFAYVLPGPPGGPTRIVIPSALQMGLMESPGYFCAATESVRDIAQKWIDSNETLPNHAFEGFMSTEAPRRQSSPGGEHQMSAVYVDDFLLAAVQSRKGDLLGKTGRATLHAIHSVFPPPSPADPPGTKDPISEKKLAKGDARWNTTKEILGYELDGIKRTVQLPTAKSEALDKELRKVIRKTRVPLKRFRSLCGRLQHAARILPAAKAFFTPLNQALRGTPSFIGLSRHGEVRQALLDAGALIQELSRRPTHVSELLERDPDYIGFCDASAFGAGGVWFSGRTSLQPSVWRVEFPVDITRQVVSDSNPTGALTNSDLELAGVLLHYSVLEQLVPDLTHVQVVIGCDNTPAVAWTRKMATRASSPIAYRLLRGLAMRQRATYAAPPAIYHVAGDTNTLADVASRALTPVSPFLPHFNARFPLPQSRSWQHVHPTSNLCSNVISTLRGQQLELRRWMTKTGPSTGKTGDAMRVVPASIPTSSMWNGRTGKTCSLPLPPGFELDYTEKVGRLDPSLWKRPCVTWRKPSSWLGTMTLGKPTVPKTSICPSGIS